MILSVLWRNYKAEKKMISGGGGDRSLTAGVPADLSTHDIAIVAIFGFPQGPSVT